MIGCYNNDIEEKQGESMPVCDNVLEFFAAETTRSWFKDFLCLKYDSIKFMSDLNAFQQEVERKCSQKYNDEVYAQKELELTERKLDRAFIRCANMESKAGVFLGMTLAVLTLVMGNILDGDLKNPDHLNYVLFFVLTGFVLFAVVIHHLWIVLKPAYMLEADDVYGGADDPIPSKKTPLTYVHQLLASNLVHLRYKDYINNKKGLLLGKAVDLSIAGLVSILLASLFASSSAWHSFLMSCLSNVC